MNYDLVNEAKCKIYNSELMNILLQKEWKKLFQKFIYTIILQIC